MKKYNYKDTYKPVMKDSKYNDVKAGCSYDYKTGDENKSPEAKYTDFEYDKKSKTKRKKKIKKTKGLFILL